MNVLNKLQNLKISDIEISKTNPRKTFDKDSLKELVSSIQQNGILQPILVRPKGKKFELVCGERRLTASKTAGIKEIPANIRELTDDEAFEFQIVENLERKDVHPLEEADAFKRMLDSGKYKLEDIAAKLAKTERFILGRLKLVDLIDPIRKDFKNDFLGIGHAVLIAKCEVDLQKEIYKNAQPWSKAYDIDYKTIKELISTINRGLYNMKDAPFDKSEKDLVKGVCACDICPKRALNNPLLFSEFQDDKKDNCFDSKCYTAKSEVYVKRELENIIADGSKIVIAASYGNIPAYITKLCKSYKLKILKEYDHFNRSERNNSIKKKAFYVSGDDVGKYKFIYIQGKSKTVKTSFSKSDVIKEDIEKIQSRAKRAVELDNEKIEAAIRTNILDKDHKIFHSKSILKSKIEMAVAVFTIIQQSRHETREWVAKKLGIPWHSSDRKAWNKILKVVDEKLFFEILMRFSLGVLTDRQVSDRGHSGYSEALYQLVNLYHPEDLKVIEADQKEKADKRIARSTKRVKDLKEALKVGESKKPAAKKSVRKKPAKKKVA